MKKIISTLMLCAVVLSASAVPARRGPITKIAADGTEKTVFLHGNAFFHYMTDESGAWLDEETLLPMSEEAKALRLNAGQKRLQARRIQQEEKVGGDLNLAPRGLIILVNFANKQFVTPVDTIKNMIDGDNYTRDYTYQYKYGGQTYTEHVVSSGSARQYFYDQSWGAYHPVFDVIGPVTVSKEYSYYGKDSGGEGNDRYPDKMIDEACKLADGLGVDFTQYDNDNDGYVDFVYVIYAGYGQADSGEANTIWPHNSVMIYGGQGTKCIVDGKQVQNYACSNELNYINDMYNGIGTFCHEFSHVLGLPDLYVTADMSNPPHTLCDWDILDYGPYNNDGNTPPCYSAYERFYCGWLTPRVLKQSEEVTLNVMHNSHEALLMCKGNWHNLSGTNPSPETFYLLEVRAKEGWDQHLPGKGMLITKIQYDSRKWKNNTVNNTATKMGVDIMEAKTNNSDYGKASDAFPAGAKMFYDLEEHDIEKIAYGTNGAVTFNYICTAQGIENVESNETSIKRIEDGQMVIIRNGKKYTVSGSEIR